MAIGLIVNELNDVLMTMDLIMMGFFFLGISAWCQST